MPNNKKLVIGNWKMNPTSIKDGEKMFSNISKNLKNIKKTEVVIAPPYVFIEKLSKIKTSKVKLGAQNVFEENGANGTGAYTGEVSAVMLENLKVKYVIVGHSERRANGETNTEINKKIKSSLSAGMTPVLCVGENVRDESHEYLNIISNQITECLFGLSKNDITDVVVAYEPVWAIGKGAVREATGSEFLEVSIYIKKVLSDKFKNSNVKILYGGSVHPQNSLEFLTEGKADGFLVGRDSLDVKKFIEIINICEI